METIPSIYVPGKSLNVFFQGKSHTIYAADAKFESAVEEYKNQNWDALHNILNPAQVFLNLYAKYEQIEVKDGNVYVSGEAISNLVASRILDFLAEGLDCVPMFKFITKLNLNPSSRAVNELYTFMEHKFLPVTVNGNFLAYKALRSDFTDVHTGKFDNNVGNVLEMPRNKVDDNKEVGCSYGFHAGTLEYARGFRPFDGKLVVVEINPADVVSIPTDCECQKLRTCKYKVVSEYEVPLEDLAYESRYTTDDDDDVDREWDDDDDDDGDFACSGCGWNRHKCEECNYCVECCYCENDDDDGCMGDPDPEEPKTEIQLELNLDNKMKVHWLDERFEFLKLLSWLYSHQRPAVANALRRFYANVDDPHMIQPVYSTLLNFTSEEDAYKVYEEFNS
jgi:hypothetical protein